MKKRIIDILFCLLMIFSCVGFNTKTITGESYDTPVSYNWSVPSSITFTKDNYQNVQADDNDSQVKIENAVLIAGKTLVISIDSLNNFKLSEPKGHTLDYSVFAGNSETALANGDEILSLSANDSFNNKNINITATLTRDEIEFAGNYSDTLTFTATLVESPDAAAAIINELNECSLLAMEQTQTAIIDSIKDKLDLIENDEFDDAKYEECYIDNFTSLVDDSSLYSLDIACNADKGIMYAKIDAPDYESVPTKEILSIVDIKGEGLDNLESLQYDIEETVTKVKATGGIRGTKAGVVKSLPDNPDGKMRAYVYNVNIAATESARPTTSNSAGPYIEIRCTDEDDNVNVINSGEGGDKAFTTLASENRCNCKLFEIVMPNDIDASKYTVPMSSVILERTSTINEYLTTKTKKADLNLSESVDIDYRYIDDITSLDSNSIWLQNEEYKDELENYLGYLQ